MFTVVLLMQHFAVFFLVALVPNRGFPECSVRVNEKAAKPRPNFVNYRYFDQEVYDEQVSEFNVEFNITLESIVVSFIYLCLILTVNYFWDPKLKKFWTSSKITCRASSRLCVTMETFL